MDRQHGRRDMSGRYQGYVRRARPAQRLAVVITCVLAGSVIACGSRSVDIPEAGAIEADRLLFERGSAAIDERDWLLAREYFIQIRDNYPQSQYRAEALLQIGDTYEGEATAESFVRALAGFQDFLSLYPTHPRAAYAQYKLGLVHFLQMNRAERDQTETLASIQEFESFIDRFPDHELMPQVQQALRGARDRLSEHDYLVGHYYFRFKNYAGAVSRFRQILDNDPGYTARDQVYFHLGEALVAVDQISEAIPYYARILEEFDASEYAEEASERLTELDREGEPER